MYRPQGSLNVPRLSVLLFGSGYTPVAPLGPTGEAGVPIPTRNGQCFSTHLYEQTALESRYKSVLELFVDLLKCQLHLPTYY